MLDTYKWNIKVKVCDIDPEAMAIRSYHHTIYELKGFGNNEKFAT